MTDLEAGPLTKCLKIIFGSAWRGVLKKTYRKTTLDVVQLTCTGIYRGHTGVREGHRIFQKSLPGATIEYTNKLVDGDVAFLEWRATAGDVEVREGADSFVITDGKIRHQTIHLQGPPLRRLSG